MTARPFDIDAFRRDAAPLLSRHSEIAVAYLFGSVARGQAHPDSDLDIGLVYGEAVAHGHDRIAPALALALSKLTGFEKIDVVDLAAQGPLFCHGVLREGVCIHERDRARRVDFESDVLVRAFDFQPTYALATRGKVAAMRRWLRERYDLGTAADEARPPEGEPRQAR